MAQEADFKELTQKICSETGKSEQEVKKLVEDKKAKFSGLLTDSGAAFMVAKELGVGVENKKQPKKSIKISDLSDGLKGLTLLVRVLHIYSPKEYQKNNKKGKYCRLLVGDETGEISLTLWGNDVKKIEQAKVERGAVLLLKDAFVSSYKEQLQLGIPFNGSIEINPKTKKAEILPKPEKIAIKLADLGEGMENIDVFARIVRIFELNEFKREGQKRKVLSFLIADETSQVRATAWNEMADTVNNLEPGQLIKIEGAYTKKGLNGTELHLGWNARIIEEPVIAFKVPELNELSSQGFERKKIRELSEGEMVEVLGTITAINKGNLLFKTCPKCGKKLVSEENGFVCEKCGEIKEPKNRLVVTVIVDDGTGAIRTSLFGRNAEKILEKSTLEIEKALQENTPSEVIEKIGIKAIGKTMLFSGRVKKNAINKEELEMSISIARKPDAKKEATKLLKELA